MAPVGKRFQRRGSPSNARAGLRGIHLAQTGDHLIREVREEARETLGRITTDLVETRHLSYPELSGHGQPTDADVRRSAARATTQAFEVDNVYYLPDLRYQAGTTDHGVSGAEARKMESDELLKGYIDQFSRDQTQLREDIRESERRITDNTRSTEERIAENIRGIEERTDARIARLEERMDTRLNRIEDMFRDLHSTVIQSNKDAHSISITVIIGVIALVLTAIGTVVYLVVRG